MEGATIMGLFRSKKSESGGGTKVPSAQVVRISADEPIWLPQRMRSAAAVGEFTFLCEACNAYPDIKWPGDGAAAAAWDIHLGSYHGKGPMAGMPRSMQTWDMIARS